MPTISVWSSLVSTWPASGVHMHLASIPSQQSGFNVDNKPLRAFFYSRGYLTLTYTMKNYRRLHEQLTEWLIGGLVHGWFVGNWVAG